MAPLLSQSTQDFLTENALCTLTTCRPDGSFHVAPVRFTWDRDAGLVRVMTVGSRRKARNISERPGARATACQLVGYRWVTLEGPATVSAEPARVAEGARRYTERYQSPPPDLLGLVVIEIQVDRVLGQH
ncbi:MAG: pyridoxamine 5-phosphate oxidase [Amycolatopsis sp.]|jgi:PPOX class probable F420-dependent enzyme|nr:pyridoxamine 5-phosphate oxidase [Amycolatopsis sp.]